MPRPSLSAHASMAPIAVSESVAGVYAPAFVERSLIADTRWRMLSCVAGVYAPAFVERLAQMIHIQ